MGLGGIIVWTAQVIKHFRVDKMVDIAVLERAVRKYLVTPPRK